MSGCDGSGRRSGVVLARAGKWRRRGQGDHSIPARRDPSQGHWTLALRYRIAGYPVLRSWRGSLSEGREPDASGVHASQALAIAQDDLPRAGKSQHALAVEL
jgi:hypothetical protein